MSRSASGRSDADTVIVSVAPVAEDALRCANAGASMVHLHVRDRAGESERGPGNPCHPNPLMRNAMRVACIL